MPLRISAQNGPFDTVMKKLATGIFTLVAVFLISSNALLLSVRYSALQFLNEAPTGAETLAKATREMRHVLFLIGALDFGAFLLAIGILFLFRSTLANPLRRISCALPGGGDEHADISAVLPLETRDEVRRIATSYNDFLRRLREITGTLRKLGVSTAYQSCLSLKRVRDSLESSKSQASSPPAFSMPAVKSPTR